MLWAPSKKKEDRTHPSLETWMVCLALQRKNPQTIPTAPSMTDMRKRKEPWKGETDRAQPEPPTAQTRAVLAGNGSKTSTSKNAADAQQMFVGSLPRTVKRPAPLYKKMSHTHRPNVHRVNLLSRRAQQQQDTTPRGPRLNSLYSCVICALLPNEMPL